MLTTIKKSRLSGSLIAPPSKSFAHRYLIASALSVDESIISNINFSDDIIATLNCIHAYGKMANRDFENLKVLFYKDFTKNFDPTFDCKESGTTLRFFFPIALEKYDKATFIGSERLIERGIGIYENILKYLTIYKDRYSIRTKGTITNGKYEIPGNISSQYISGLLYALPLLKDDSEVALTTSIESKNYILMTIDVLKKYGIKIDVFGLLNDDLENQNNKTKFENVVFKIEGNQKYKAINSTIEGDYSNAAFIDAFNYFGNDISLIGLNLDSLQSDKLYKKYFDELASGSATLDISNCIDLGPILITFASLKNGGKFIGTNRLKIKESDRGTTIAAELSKCGAEIDIYDNEIIVKKKELTMPKDPLYSHNDHRIAMSLSLLSTKFDISINDSECVSKSYPNYFSELKKLGAEII